MASVFKSFIASSVMTLLCFSLCFYPFTLAQDSGTATFNTPLYVHLCPPDSSRATIDLSQEAFASIADPNSGVVNISYQHTPQDLREEACIEERTRRILVNAF
ncbi:hypothetical protein POTOM_014724 [Populus tomentosa]|uniref:Uncharacterized protein n=1 Tax=Populus tomentosa TaxID=118781 RepID=A0A8X8D822_POPTO|nr:hypothetical protein POTOM_014724 [Populus tomentosa]